MALDEIAVDEHRTVAGDDHRLGDVAVELLLIADDFHGAAAQHIGGADDDREADLPGDLAGFGGGAGDAVLGLAQFELLAEAWRSGRGLRRDRWHRAWCRESARRRSSSACGEIERRLAAELDDDAFERAVRLLGVDDFEHVFGGQRLEIEPVGRVVIGRHGFRIAVDHDRFIARIMQREAGMAAAIIEFDALADAVGPAAEDDDLLACRKAALRCRRRRRSPSHRSNTCRRWARRIRRRRYRCA